MYKEVKIGDKTVPMLSMASVDLYYKNIFAEDPIKLQTSEIDSGDMINFTVRMGFVMAEFAKRKERKEMLKLNEEAFYDWMDQFPREDLYDMDKLVEIHDVYEGNITSTSESKKEEDQETENRMSHCLH